jgi:hypothetical protein
VDHGTRRWSRIGSLCRLLREPQGFPAYGLSLLCSHTCATETHPACPRSYPQGRRAWPQPLCATPACTRCSSAALSACCDATRVGLPPPPAERSRSTGPWLARAWPIVSCTHALAETSRASCRSCAKSHSPPLPSRKMKPARTGAISTATWRASARTPTSTLMPSRNPTATVRIRPQSPHCSSSHTARDLPAHRPGRGLSSPSWDTAMRCTPSSRAPLQRCQSRTRTPTRRRPAHRHLVPRAAHAPVQLPRAPLQRAAAARARPAPAPVLSSAPALRLRCLELRPCSRRPSRSPPP